MSLGIQEASTQLIAYFRYHLPHAVWNQYYDKEDSDLKEILNSWHHLKEIKGSQILVTYEIDYPALKRSIIKETYDQWRIEDLSRDPFLVLAVDLKEERKAEFEKHPTKFRITQLQSGFPKYIEDFLIETSQSGRSFNVALQRVLLEKTFSKQKVVTLVEKFFYDKEGKPISQRLKKAEDVLAWLDTLDEKK